MPRKPHSYHYIYKTECIPTGKYYIGMHSSSIDPAIDLYLGSGIHLRRSIKKWGLDSHKREILEFCKDRDSLKKRESEIVNEMVVKDPLCMNLRLGGGGYNEEQRPNFIGWEKANQFWQSEEGKAKLRIMGASSKGRRYKLTEPRKKRSVDPHKDKVWMSRSENRETKFVERDLIESYIKEGWYKGRLKKIKP